MQPSPPAAMKGSAVASFRTRAEIPRAESCRKRDSRATSPVASFNPMKCLELASRSRVSSDSPRMVRDGTSCRMMGSARRDSNCPEVCLDFGLHRFVEVGHHRKHRIGAGRFGALRQFDCLTDRIGIRRRPRRGRGPRAALTAVRMMLFPFRCLSASEASPLVSLTTNGADAGVNLTLAKHRKGRQIQGAVLVERRGNVGM